MVIATPLFPVVVTQEERSAVIHVLHSHHCQEAWTYTLYHQNQPNLRILWNNKKASIFYPN